MKNIIWVHLYVIAKIVKPKEIEKHKNDSQRLGRGDIGQASLMNSELPLRRRKNNSLHEWCQWIHDWVNEPTDAVHW